MHPSRNQNQPKPAPSADDRTTTGAGAPQTPELLATIARRLGISPSKGANAADGEDTISQSNDQNTDDDGSHNCYGHPWFHSPCPDFTSRSSIALAGSRIICATTS